MKLNYRKIGEIVRAERKRRGWTQEVLAERISVSPQYVSQIENGRANISLEKVVELATAFRISTDTLLGSRKGSWKEEQTRAEKILQDCTNYEYEVIIGLMESTKKVLRQNSALYKE